MTGMAMGVVIRYFGFSKSNLKQCIRASGREFADLIDRDGESLSVKRKEVLRARLDLALQVELTRFQAAHDRDAADLRTLLEMVEPARRRSAIKRAMLGL